MKSKHLKNYSRNTEYLTTFYDKLDQLRSGSIKSISGHIDTYINNVNNFNIVNNNNNTNHNYINQPSHLNVDHINSFHNHVLFNNNPQRQIAKDPISYQLQKRPKTRVTTSYSKIQSNFITNKQENNNSNSNSNKFSLQLDINKPMYTDYDINDMKRIEKSVLNKLSINSQNQLYSPNTPSITTIPSIRGSSKGFSLNRKRNENKLMANLNNINYCYGNNSNSNNHCKNILTEDQDDQNENEDDKLILLDFPNNTKGISYRNPNRNSQSTLFMSSSRISNYNYKHKEDINNFLSSTNYKSNRNSIRNSNNNMSNSNHFQNVDQLPFSKYENDNDLEKLNHFFKNVIEKLLHNIERKNEINSENVFKHIFNEIKVVSKSNMELALKKIYRRICYLNEKNADINYEKVKEILLRKQKVSIDYDERVETPLKPQSQIFNKDSKQIIFSKTSGRDLTKENLSIEDQINKINKEIQEMDDNELIVKKNTESAYSEDNKFNTIGTKKISSFSGRNSNKYTKQTNPNHDSSKNIAKKFDRPVIKKFTKVLEDDYGTFVKLHSTSPKQIIPHQKSLFEKKIRKAPFKLKLDNVRLNVNSDIKQYLNQVYQEILETDETKRNENTDDNKLSKSMTSNIDEVNKSNKKDKDRATIYSKRDMEKTNRSNFSLFYDKYNAKQLNMNLSKRINDNQTDRSNDIVILNLDHKDNKDKDKNLNLNNIETKEILENNNYNDLINIYNGEKEERKRSFDNELNEMIEINRRNRLLYEKSHSKVFDNNPTPNIINNSSDKNELNQKSNKLDHHDNINNNKNSISNEIKEETKPKEIKTQTTNTTNSNNNNFKKKSTFINKAIIKKENKTVSINEKTNNENHKLSKNGKVIETIKEEDKNNKDHKYSKENKLKKKIKKQKTENADIIKDSKPGFVKKKTFVIKKDEYDESSSISSRNTNNNHIRGSDMKDLSIKNIGKDKSNTNLPSARLRGVKNNSIRTSNKSTYKVATRKYTEKENKDSKKNLEKFRTDLREIKNEESPNDKEEINIKDISIPDYDKHFELSYPKTMNLGEDFFNKLKESELRKESRTSVISNINPSSGKRLPKSNSSLVAVNQGALLKHLGEKMYYIYNILSYLVYV